MMYLCLKSMKVSWNTRNTYQWSNEKTMETERKFYVRGSFRAPFNMVCGRTVETIVSAVSTVRDSRYVGSSTCLLLYFQKQTSQYVEDHTDSTFVAAALLGITSP